MRIIAAFLIAAIWLVVVWVLVRWTGLSVERALLIVIVLEVATLGTAHLRR